MTNSDYTHPPLINRVIIPIINAFSCHESYPHDHEYKKRRSGKTIMMCIMKARRSEIPHILFYQELPDRAGATLISSLRSKSFHVYPFDFISKVKYFLNPSL